VAPFPRPPKEILEFGLPRCIPAHDLKDWAFKTFVEDGGELQNLDHDHLKFAEVLFLWASEPAREKGKDVIGYAEMFSPQFAKFGQVRSAQFIRDANNGQDPDFIVTICAPFVAEADPNAVLALIEHELYHCGQEVDEYGCPKFNKKGLPKFAMKGHDVEEFVGVVRRYGAWSPGLQELKSAIDSAPLISKSQSEAVYCGCGARV